jgi:hypothetical protein
MNVIRTSRGLEEPTLTGLLEAGRRRRRPERATDECGVLRARDVVEVLHRDLDVRVAHPLLDAADVCDAEDPRAEGVAEVVEAERSERGSLEGGSVALGER